MSPLSSRTILCSILPLAFALTGFGSCDPEPAAADAPATQRCELKLGETATPLAGGPTLTFAAVVADSRCPTGVTCVWAGQVTVAVEVSGAGAAQRRLELTLGPDADKAQSDLDGYRLRLLTVDPHPRAGTKTERSAYRAGFELEKR
jgi:hypothetical protein